MSESEIPQIDHKTSDSELESIANQFLKLESLKELEFEKLESIISTVPRLNQRVANEVRLHILKTFDPDSSEYSLDSTEQNNLLRVVMTAAQGSGNRAVFDTAFSKLTDNAAFESMHWGLWPTWVASNIKDRYYGEPAEHRHITNFAFAHDKATAFQMLSTIPMQTDEDISKTWDMYKRFRSESKDEVAIENLDLSNIAYRVLTHGINDDNRLAAEGFIFELLTNEDFYGELSTTDGNDKKVIQRPGVTDELYATFAISMLDKYFHEIMDEVKGSEKFNVIIDRASRTGKLDPNTYHELLDYWNRGEELNFKIGRGLFTRMHNGDINNAESLYGLLDLANSSDVDDFLTEIANDDSFSQRTAKLASEYWDGNNSQTGLKLLKKGFTGYKERLNEMEMFLRSSQNTPELLSLIAQDDDFNRSFAYEALKFWDEQDVQTGYNLFIKAFMGDHDIAQKAEEELFDATDSKTQYELLKLFADSDGFQNTELYNKLLGYWDGKDTKLGITLFEKSFEDKNSLESISQEVNTELNTTSTAMRTANFLKSSDQFKLEQVQRILDIAEQFKWSDDSIKLAIEYLNVEEVYAEHLNLPMEFAPDFNYSEVRSEAAVDFVPRILESENPKLALDFIRNNVEHYSISDLIKTLDGKNTSYGLRSGIVTHFSDSLGVDEYDVLLNRPEQLEYEWDSIDNVAEGVRNLSEYITLIDSNSPEVHTQGVKLFFKTRELAQKATSFEDKVDVMNVYAKMHEKFGENTDSYISAAGKIAIDIAEDDKTFIGGVNELESVLSVAKDAGVWDNVTYSISKARPELYKLIKPEVEALRQTELKTA